MSSMLYSHAGPFGFFLSMIHNIRDISYALGKDLQSVSVEPHFPSLIQSLYPISYNTPTNALNIHQLLHIMPNVT